MSTAFVLSAGKSGRKIQLARGEEEGRSKRENKTSPRRASAQVLLRALRVSEACIIVQGGGLAHFRGEIWPRPEALVLAKVDTTVEGLFGGRASFPEAGVFLRELLISAHLSDPWRGNASARCVRT
ncbi:hypothetical protein KM043_004205 [Ampulex compressa]|nr:hypothetical protein KM043_004205 [Ampulex compressa]